MNEAHKHGLSVCFHIEPYAGRSAQSVRDNIKSLIAQFGHYPAFYRINGKPCFFVYDSYLIPADDWATLLQPKGRITIRGTEWDAVIIGLWVKRDEEDFFTTSGMDGFYTYFAATGFTYGSTPYNWIAIQQWASDHGKIFIPCVGPGYIDTRVRPWNGATIRDRENGRYYDKMFQDAIESKATCMVLRLSMSGMKEPRLNLPFLSVVLRLAIWIIHRWLRDYYLNRTAYWVGEMEKLREN